LLFEKVCKIVDLIAKLLFCGHIFGKSAVQCKPEFLKILALVKHTFFARHAFAAPVHRFGGNQIAHLQCFYVFAHSDDLSGILMSYDHWKFTMACKHRVSLVITGKERRIRSAYAAASDFARFGLMVILPFALE
jgi:hypothetical protein